MLLWQKMIGVPLNQAGLGEHACIALTVRCILHAFATNLTYFSARINPETFKRAETLLSGLAGASKVTDIGSQDLSDAIDALFPKEDSPEEIVPGWVALLDALAQLSGYPQNRENLDSLYYAIASAYQSVSSRAYAELIGAEGNCDFGDQQQDEEARNPICVAELKFQFEEIAKAASE